MIRFICIAVFLILYLILSIPVFLVEWIIGKFNRRAKDISSLRIVQWGFKVILKMTGVTTTVIGEENVPDEPVLFIGNHRSYFDILLTYSRCRRLTGYVAKKEMEKIPLLSTWMKNLYCLFLDRDNMREGLKTILQAIDYVKNGISICIFPEGTRNKVPDTFLPFHAGSFKIAEKSGCLIIPVAITNTENVFENHIPFIKASTVIIEFGDPIDLNAMPKEERRHIGSQVQGIIGGMLSYPVASLIMGNQSAALFTFVVPFLVSTCGGTVLAAVITVSMAKMGVLAKLQNGEV